MNQAGTPAQSTPAQGTPVAGSAEDLKAKKAEANALAKKRKLERLQEQYKSSLALRDELVSHQFFDKLTEKAKGFILSLCKDPSIKKVGGFGGPSVFAVIFGANAKVGDSVTFEAAMHKTLKGKADLDKYCKRWTEKGIVVEFLEDKADIFKSTYTIKSINVA
jgi:hypothetical protein